MQILATKSHEETRKGDRSGVFCFCAFLCLFVANAPALIGAGLSIPPGEVVEFTAPLDAELRRFESTDDQPHDFTEALCAVAVPQDFAPDREWPVLLVSATSDPGYNSSRRLLHQFAAPALKAGWIVIAADAPRNVEAVADTDQLRYALLTAALNRLQVEWPGLAHWPRAFGGFSGGAKRSAILGAFSTLLGHPPIGFYQAGCNAAVLTRVLAIPGLPQKQFLATPVFLSSGRQDPIAPPAIMQSVADELTRTGFSAVKIEQFTGGHEVCAPHITEALLWFAETNQQGRRAK